MPNRRTVLATGVGLALGGRALAQAPSAEEQAAQRGFFTEGRYVPYYALLRRKGAESADMFGTVQAMLGQEAEAFRTFSPAKGPWSPAMAAAWNAPLAQASTEDALAAIDRAATGRRLIILNEAHHISRSRGFAIQVARVLRASGVTHFAAETLSRTSPTADLTVVSTRTGFYSQDPVFAGLLRDIRNDWEAAFSYEAPSNPAITDARERTAFREEHQAETLAAILKRDPKIRLFVYCGYGHAEKVEGGGMRMMAARLWEKTGIEPLTIHQSNGAPAPNPEDSWPGVEAVLQRFEPKTSIALWGPDGKALSWTSSRAGYDLSIFHPRVQDRGSRPGWLATLPGRQRVRTPVPPGPGLRLVQVVPTLEHALSPSAVPADQVLVEDERRSVDLWLPPGAYDLCCETLSGKTQISTFTV
jgi:hypothetical protein